MFLRIPRIASFPRTVKVGGFANSNNRLQQRDNLSTLFHVENGRSGADCADKVFENNSATRLNEESEQSDESDSTSSGFEEGLNGNILVPANNPQPDELSISEIKRIYRHHVWFFSQSESDIFSSQKTTEIIQILQKRAEQNPGGASSKTLDELSKTFPGIFSK